MSKTKTVYVLNRGSFCKLQNQGKIKCIRCQIEFEENDIIATSAASQRYCYKCASNINLVSGDVTKDLGLDGAFKETTNQIRKISQKIKAEKSIKILAIEIIKESFARSLIQSKNLTGLACAAIYFATVLSGQKNPETIASHLPTSFRVIQKNLLMLRCILMNSKLLEKFDGSYL
ncbi:MAG: hypothetical protein ACR2LL_03180 [Nitrosopumilus sp.]|uniref:hypothetical protein n=1 Tax=Nitrosopumilus sp. TaxID=2024843 RepID=UPI002931E5A6|nr:hypothetical protein [Nitrosopumilus sp.]